MNAAPIRRTREPHPAGVLAVALGTLPGWAFAAGTSRSFGEAVIALPLLVALAIALHVGCGRAAKWFFISFAPLASGEEEAVRYQRSVYGTAARDLLGVIALVVAGGVAWWLGYTFKAAWLLLLGVGLVSAGVMLDLLRWERASASANFVWFSRGLKRKVHQIAIENIRDLAVEEKESGGFTLLHGKRNRVCRVHVKLLDKRIVSLPRTDAARVLEDVEALANHVRARLQLLAERRGIERAERDSDLAPLSAEPVLSPEERELRREVERRRTPREAKPRDDDTLDAPRRPTLHG